jgi:voltage-gated potassium channel
MTQEKEQGPLSGWRGRVHEIIYEADTPTGKLFDVVLIATILLSVVAVMLETVQPIGLRYGPTLRLLEWVFTLLFTVEYGLRLLTVRRPWRYATSFYGVVDLLAILPTYASFFFPATRFLLVIRILRVLRVFRVLKLVRYLNASRLLVQALAASRVKIAVFLYAVLTMVVVIGSLMYMIEGGEHGFTSIPRSIYWAIVTLTTVGYGDISPQTALGQTLAAVVMILGYGIIAVPTGIVTVELQQQVARMEVSAQACPDCGRLGHDRDARYCKHCGASLD